MNKPKQNKALNYAIDLVMMVVGTAILALGVYMFATPNNISPGGFNGISIIVNHLLNIPVGTVNLMINVPVMIIGFIMLGKHFVIKSIVSIFSFTIFYDYVYAANDLFTYKGDVLLASLFGGVVMGIGCALVFMRGGSTGGTAMLSKVVEKKSPHMQIGRISFFLDATVILASAVVFKNIDVAMYATISVFIYGVVVDTILYGLDEGKMVYIMSNKSEEIAKELLKNEKFGVTKFKSIGGYTGKDNDTIMCVIKKSHYYGVKKIVYTVDPSAFMILTKVNEVCGEGFKEVEKV